MKKWKHKTRDENGHIRLYSCYKLMKQRCNPNNIDKNHKKYRENNIKVCEEWSTNWDNFYEWAMNNGYSDNLTLDRIDPLKDYCPENCRWITLQENISRSNQNRDYSYRITSKKIICVETNEIFPMISAAERKLSKDGKTTGALSRCVKNNIKYKGFTFIPYKETN